MLKESTPNVPREQTISSKEIAKLIGKEHYYILRDCNKLNERYEKLHLSKIGEMLTLSDLPNGEFKEDRVYLLTKNQTLDLLKTGYRSDYCIKVISRWIELEEENENREREIRVTEPTDYDKEALKERLIKANERLLREKRLAMESIMDHYRNKL